MPPDVVFFWEAGSGKPQDIDQTLTVLEAQGFCRVVRGMVVGTIGTGDYHTGAPSEPYAMAALRPLRNTTSQL